jgi:hypothetical protein
MNFKKMAKKKKDQKWNLDTENLDVNYERKDGNTSLEIDTKIIDVISTKEVGKKRKTRVRLDKKLGLSIARITRQIIERVIKRN